MNNFTVYDKVSGKILRFGYASSPDIELQIFNAEIEDVVALYADSNTNYIDIDTLQAVKFPPKPSEFYDFDWDTKQWVYSLDSNKSSALSTVDQLASDKITSVYPIYRQINIESDFGRDSVQYAVMRTYINKVRDAANQATDSVNASTAESEIDFALDAYKKALDSII